MSADAEATPMIMDGFVFGRGPAGACDEFRVGGGIVDYDAVGGVWRMWVYCRDHELHRRAPKTLGSGRVRLATSLDGIDWIRQDGPLTGGAVFGPSDTPGTFDSLHVAVTDVTRGAGEWLMWYFGGDEQPRETSSWLGTVVGLGLRPGLARSADGVEWRRSPGETPSGALFEIDAGKAYAAWSAVFFDGRQLVMHYSAPDEALDQYAAMIAVSDDGRVWRKAGPLVWADGAKPWDCTGIITRQVIPNPLPGGRRFLMVYTGTDAAHGRSVAAADSDDGRVWTHLYDGPIFRIGEPGAWDSAGVAATRLVPACGRLHLYYYGFQSLADNDRPRGIGLAVCDTDDLRDLKRIPRPAAA